MKRNVPVLALLLILAHGATAQTLAHCAPGDTLVYFRQSNPLSNLSKMLGSNALFTNPVDLQKDFLDGIDKVLEHGDKFLGMELGSISTYLRSITNFEGALYRLELTDGFPELDWVFVLQTPMADQIYKLLSGKLVEEKLGTAKGDKETQVDVAGEFGMNIGQDGDKIILASDQRVLRETTKVFGNVVAGCLAQNARFQAAIGGEIDNCLYARTDTFLKMLKEERGGGGMFMRGAPSAMLEAFGLWNLGALGYHEGEKQTRISMLGNSTVPAFEIFSGEGGPPDLFGAMPADIAFGFVYSGDMVNVWKRGSALVLDPNKFPPARMAEEAIKNFQQMTGLKAEEIAAAAQGGFAFGVIPDEHGRIRGNEENFFFILKSPDPSKSNEIAAKLGEMITKRGGGKVETKSEGDVTWYSYEKENSGRKIPVLAIARDCAVIGIPANVQKVLDIKSGKYASLATMQSTKGVKPNATAYFFIGMKTLFAQESEFSSGHGQLKDGAGIAGSIEISPERIIITTNHPLGHIMNAVGAMGVSMETSREDRNLAIDELRKIATAYRLHRGAHNGKDPVSLSELGFSGDKALLFPPKRPANVEGKPYTLMAAGAVSEIEESSTIVAYAPDSSLGRLVATLDGDARSLSESRFQQMLSRQKARLAEAASEKK